MLKKIAIQTNKYFSIESWKRTLFSHNFQDKYEFEFAPNRKEFITKSQDAMFGFTFNLDTESFLQSKISTPPLELYAVSFNFQ